MTAGQKERKASIWGKLIPALVGAVIGVLLIAFDDRLPPMHVLLGAFLSSLFLSVAVHEAGHAVAGVVFGFRCVQISAWPLVVSRSSTGWTVRSSPWGQRMLGYAVFYPRSGRNLRQRMLAMTAGGPVASLLAGVAAALCASLIAWLFLPVFMFALCSILLGITDFLPLKGKPIPSDGARIRMLLRGGPAAERWCNLALLVGASMEGTRPRDLDPELIRLVTSIQDESFDALSAATFHYNWSVDSGRIDEAAGLLSWILENRQQLPEPARAAWLCEAAWFEALFRKDLDAAKKWMDHPENRESRLAAGARWKAEVAIAALESRFDEAESAARKALRELERSPDLGVVKAIRESLARITAREPENARPTVLP